MAPKDMLSSLRCTYILLWCFSFLLAYSSCTPSSAATNANETDLLALLAIKSQLRMSLGVAGSWNNSTPLCLWPGVSCGRRHQRVTKLDLSNQKIGGRLSPYVGNLSFLRFLDLEGNSFYGEVPSEIGRLFRLQILSLGNNSFSGAIPNNLSYCSNLIQILAYNNNLQGELPADIGHLSKLKEIAVGENQLTGQLPTSIGNLSSLTTLVLRANSFGGRIPDTFGQLRNLRYLHLGRTNLSGTVPPSIFNISSMEILFLSFNSFNGSLPLNIGFTLPNLKTFVINNNDFIGMIPNSFSNASNIEQIDFSTNHFSGKVSIDFTNLQNLSFLNLGVNNLGTGSRDDLETVTFSLTNCRKLEWFVLADNQFGGVLPHAIANLSTTMIGIAIGGNQLSGTIPEGIAKLVNLTLISMGSNRLNGPIPHTIGELKRLQALLLQENNLQGSIPSSLGNLKLLNTLRLGSNSLAGNIPSSLGNCQNLIQLLLQNNKLNGVVPQEVLGITTLSLGLDLSENLLTGPFPLGVGHLNNLLALNISRNRFYGEIPVTLGSCTSLENLDIQGNFFSGSIPSSLSSLRSIKRLDLSFNNLSGQIPKFLQNLSFLEYLNLSYNQFEGEVPAQGVFSNTTMIYLDGNEKLCGGVTQLQLPLCRSKGPNKSKLKLLKVVIPVIVSCFFLSSCFLIICTRRRKSAKKSSTMLHLEEQFPMVTYAELSRATNEFSLSHMIGQGSHGFVYRGILGTNLVAIKVINLEQKGACKSFMAECETLRTVRHRNLVKIITLCSSIDFKGVDFKALVFEYMENGSLEEWLHQTKDESGTRRLSLIQRLNIVIDVASAIEYLHHHCEPSIIHGDLKPSNILLDDDMVAHVGDFGLAKFLSNHQHSTALETQTSSIGIKGTIGYVAPEYGMGSQPSIPGDVHSFGILLLEMFTGRRPTDSMFINGLTLHEFARMACPERVMEIAEPALLLEMGASNNTVHNFGECREENDKIEECLVAVVRTGVQCSMKSPAERMDMTDVVAKLCAVRENFLHRII